MISCAWQLLILAAVFGHSSMAISCQFDNLFLATKITAVNWIEIANYGKNFPSSIAILAMIKILPEIERIDLA